MGSRFAPALLAAPVLLAATTAAAQTTVQFNVDASQDVKTISPYIYGRNSDSTAPLTRLGGNRWTAYNWETNASNAGSDWGFQNDGYLSNSNTPGAAVLPWVQNAAANNQALIVTVPMAGYVSADKNGDGDVRYFDGWKSTDGDPNTNPSQPNPTYLQDRFNQSVAAKGSAFSLTPNTSDDFVYQDEFVNWLENSARVNAQQPLFYSLDNEPGLWASTHAEVHPNAVTYAELRQKTIDTATAIKNVAPDALVFGPVNYGWNAFRNLQGAPDAGTYGDFHEYYLAQMAAAETSAGKRLVDVLDIHWYPEAQDSTGTRIVFGSGQDNNSASMVAARVQAPRSLWDPTYTEQSWITQWSTGGPIDLLGRVQEDIDTYYPGTKIGITEYNYGGGGHISGGIAQADALGVFGREGVFAATWWDLSGNADAYVYSAFDMFLNYDGQGSGFGGTSIGATTNDIEKTSIYASIDPNDPDRMVLVLINKSDQEILADVSIAALGKDYDLAKVFRLLASSSSIEAGTDIDITGNSLSYTMPAFSVTTLELTVVPEPGALALVGLGGAALLLRRRR